MIQSRFLPSEKEKLFKAKQLLEQMRQKLVIRIPGFDRRIRGEAMHHYGTIWREAILHRLLDLGESAREMFIQRRLIPGNILTRSLYETLALQFYYLQKNKDAIKTGNAMELEEVIHNGLMGRRDDPGLPVPNLFPQSINVLTLLNKMDKVFKGIRHEYDHLSEYAHPYLKGTLGGYVEPGDPPETETRLGRAVPRYDMAVWGLGTLSVGLEIGLAIHVDLANLESDFIALIGSNREKLP